ncbi:hypothetical protein WN48_05688 [Eufriesea mexicana]|nr:hypothetical protein WN48_05688 [Eufriesea mexicana]
MLVSLTPTSLKSGPINTRGLRNPRSLCSQPSTYYHTAKVSSLADTTSYLRDISRN